MGVVAVAASRLINFLSSGKVDIAPQPAEEANESKRRRMMDSASSSGPSLLLSRQQQAAAAATGVVVAAAAADEEDDDAVDESQLDRLYRLNEEHTRALPPFLPSLPLLRKGVELRRYQRQALAWMLKREGGREGGNEGGMHLKLREGRQGGKKIEEEGEEKGGETVVLENAAVAAVAGGRGGREGGKASVWLGEGLVKVSTEEMGEHELHHPLWDRCFMAEVEGGREGGVRLVNPVPFYSNPYSKVVQMERPLPPKECRGGILADDMVRGGEGGREGGREGGGRDGGQR